MKKKPLAHNLTTRIQEGDYTHDEIARMLLWASGDYREAKKALTRAHNKLNSVAPWRLRDGVVSKGGNDRAVYLAAYAIKQKSGCSDFTALRKLLGDTRYRTYWNRLKARRQTLRQAAGLV
jgi:hypothetical protein